MAKALKVGEAVTVRKNLRLRRKDPAYKEGLKGLKNGEIGHVVTAGDDKSRSVVVDFKGIQVTLASQRLDRIEPPAAETVGTSSNSDSEGQSANGGGRANRRAGSTVLGLVNLKAPDFVAEVANKLLVAGGLDPDPETIVVQVKLSDLPAQVQKQVKTLMNAKLDLGRQPSVPRRKRAAKMPARPPARRGRKPKST